jgi:signal recognition particle subunit SRP54
MEEKLRKAEFTLDDLLDQLRTIRKMGSLGGLMKMIPGLGKQLRDAPVDDRQLDRVEAIILSMTPEERRLPEIVNGTRRARIARGSGTSVQQINALLQQHRQMKKMMKTLAGGKMPGLPGLPGMSGASAGGVSKKRKKKR